MSAKLRRIKEPHIGFPMVVTFLGTLSLLTGWMIAGPEGFSIASGCVSVLGLGVTAYAASEIWQLKNRYVRIIDLREIIRRLERVQTELSRAVNDKEFDTIRGNVGRLHALVRESKLPTSRRAEIESITALLPEILQCDDNRKLPRLARELLLPLAGLIENSELELHQQESGASNVRAE